jgi:hypothetical protein
MLQNKWIHKNFELMVFLAFMGLIHSFALGYVKFLIHGGY